MNVTWANRDYWATDIDLSPLDWNLKLDSTQIWSVCVFTHPGSLAGLSDRRTERQLYLAERTYWEVPSAIGVTDLYSNRISTVRKTRLTRASGWSANHWTPVARVTPLHQETWIDQRYTTYKAQNSSDPIYCVWTLNGIRVKWCASPLLFYRMISK